MTVDTLFSLLQHRYNAALRMPVRARLCFDAAEEFFSL